MTTTTLNKIREHYPCTEGWTKLLKGLGKTGPDDEPLPMSTILSINGLDDAIWCLRTLEGADREIRLFAVGCARQQQHLLTDPRSLSALDVAERFANGAATEEELAEASAAASAAADASAAAWSPAWAAADAAASDVAYAASAAARAAASAAASAAAWAAAWAAAYAASAAAYAAGSAACAARASAYAAGSAACAARASARAKQEKLFRGFFG